MVRFSDLPTIKVEGADKYGHFTFHFGFTLLWGFYSWLQRSSIVFKSLIKVVLFSLGYGILIEFLQETFTTTRHADVFDVLANFTRAVTAFVILVLVKKIKKE